MWKVITGRAEIEIVNAELFAQTSNSLVATPGELVKPHAYVGIVGVDGSLPSCLGVSQGDFTHAWKFCFHWVGNPKGDGVVFAGKGGQWFVDILTEKIRDEKNQGFTLHGVKKKITS